MTMTYVTCRKCASTRCVKTVQDHYGMKSFCITVSQLTDQLSTEDRDQSPTGVYFFSGESKEIALDDFHMCIPIKVLDDFHIGIQEIGPETAVELFRAYLEQNNTRCGNMNFKLRDEKLPAWLRLT
jgi:hypothetical protein